LGCMVAAISRKGYDTVPLVARMLQVLDHGDGAGCGLFTLRGSTQSRSLPELLTQELRSPICIGYSLSGSRELGTVRSTMWVSDFSSVVEGHLFSDSGKKLLETLGNNESMDIQSLLREVDGDYAMISMKGGKLVAYRDPIGTVPLYIGEEMGSMALAPEKKALWTIGMLKARPFPPGHLLEGKIDGDTTKLIKKISPSPTVSNDPAEVTDRLTYLIRRAVGKRVDDLSELALAFSGGLDSGVLAKILQEMGIKVHLICVGIEGSLEMSQAEDVASELCLPITARVFPKDSVENVITQAIWHVEDFDPLKVSLGIPLYWVSGEARDLGMNFLMTGQGCDELFGGYLRHEEVFQDQGGKALDEMLLRDVEKAHEVDYELVSKVCSGFQIGHLAPYADMDLITYALGIPPKLKMSYEGQILRKAVLRRVAKGLGLPESVYTRPKKAMQYGTGVDKVLRVLAKDRGLSVRGYLEKRFLEVFPKIPKSNENNWKYHC
jgi:asparagine synthase (glutamine-hydrolysing)